MQVQALNAVTATTTSSAIDVSNICLLSVMFTCANHASGNGVFTIDASNDGINWQTSIAFGDSTATANKTYITSKTLSSNTSALAFLGADFSAKMIRIVCTVSTDGSYTAVVFGNKLAVT